MIEIYVNDDGSARAVHGEGEEAEAAHMLRDLGFPPFSRASHVECVAAGPYAWSWYADMSPLGQGHELCLWPPREVRAEALADERRYLNMHWLKGCP